MSFSILIDLLLAFLQLHFHELHLLHGQSLLLLERRFHLLDLIVLGLDCCIPFFQLIG
jgi:hypothetical protein